MSSKNRHPLCVASATPFFESFRAACQADGGKLWGIPLYGPMLLLDVENGILVGNEPDGEGRLEKEGGLFVSSMPNDISPANTAQAWAGTCWTTVLWSSLGSSPEGALSLMAHENFHRIQEETGLCFPLSSCAHLDTAAGASLLLLENRALLQAFLSGSENEARTHATHALAFRSRRHSLFPQALQEEGSLEAHEGSAEYTGLRLAGEAFARKSLTEHCRILENSPGMSRSFPYVTGTLLCFLLNHFAPDWKRSFWKRPALSELLSEILNGNSSGDLLGNADSLAEVYDTDGLRQRQQALAEARLERQTSLRARLVAGPVLVLPSDDVCFDPNTKLSLGDDGDFYAGVEIRGEWGKALCPHGALVNWSRHQVSLPKPPVMAGHRGPGTLSWEGHELHLESGFELASGPRHGDLAIASSVAPA